VVLLSKGDGGPTENIYSSFLRIRPHVKCKRISTSIRSVGNFPHPSIRTREQRNGWLNMQGQLDFARDCSKGELRFENTDGLLMESIAESFAALLGPSAKDAWFRYLLRNQAIGTKEIPARLEDFDGSLREVFGRAAQVIERNILTRFYHKLGLTFSSKKGHAFSDQVDEARRSFHYGLEV
jgi:hypothetical protein